MSYTPIPKGTDPWDEQVNNAFTGQDARITANADAITAVQVVNDDQWTDINANRTDIDELDSSGLLASSRTGFIATNYPPEFGQGGAGLTNGSVSMIRITLPQAATVTSIVLPVFTGGSGLTANQCFAGLYDASGNRLAVTADQSAVWNAIGLYTMNLVTPVNVPAGTYYVALLANGATPPSPLRSLGAAGIPTLINYGVTSADYRWSIGATAQTSLPATINMNTRTATGLAFWTGLV